MPVFSRRSLIASTLVGVFLGIGLFVLDSQLSERVGQLEIGIAFRSPNQASGSELTSESDTSVTQTSTALKDETETTSPIVSTPPATTVPLPANIDQSWRDRLILLTNVEREKEGLEPLEACPTLHVAAQAHAFAMGDQDFFEHENPFTGDRPSTRGEQAGYGPYVGENIALGYESPKAVIRGWMNSPGHRDNILGNYKHLGIGIYLGRSSQYGNGIFWVQNFGSSGDCG
jgi:uncharacterized protein YkwD